MLCGYSLPEINAFSVVDRNEDSHGGWIKYKNDDLDSTIRVSIAKGGTEYVDTENLNHTEELNIQGYISTLYEKDNRITITWSDSDHGYYITLVCTDLNKDFAIQIAEQVVFFGT